MDRTCISSAIICVLTFSLFGAPPAVIWEHKITGPNLGKSRHAIQTSVGGFAIAGYINGTGSGLNDIILVSTNPSGDTLWTKTYGGTQHDNGAYILEMEDNGFLLLGSTRSFGQGNFDMWAIRTNSQGDTIWTRTYGSADNDFGSMALQQGRNEFILMGYTFPQGSAFADVYIVVIDINGNVKLTKQVGGQYTEMPVGICPVKDGGFVLTGHRTTAENTSPEIMLLRLNNDLDSMWIKSIVPDSFVYKCMPYGYHIKQAKNGNFIIAASNENNPLLICTDSAGVVLWQRLISGGMNSLLYWLEHSPDNGFVITGYTEHHNVYGGKDAWIVKVDSNGAPLWDYILGDKSDDAIISITSTQDKGYIAAGYSISPLNSKYNIWYLRLGPDTAVYVTPHLTADINDAPEITTTALKQAYEDKPYTDTLHAQDPNGHLLYWSLISPPAGLKVDVNTGILSWVPSDSNTGINSFKVIVTDGLLSDSKTMTVQVMSVNDTPRIEMAFPEILYIDSFYYVSLQAKDDDSDSLSWTIIRKPAGMIVEFNKLIWQPALPDMGLDTLILAVSDGLLSDTALLAFSVIEYMNLETRFRKAFPKQLTVLPSPNPFHLYTKIIIGIPKRFICPAVLEIINIHGKRVNQWQLNRPGYHTLKWDGKDINGNLLGSGIYFAVFGTKSNTIKRKLMVIR